MQPQNLQRIIKIKTREKENPKVPRSRRNRNAKWKLLSSEKSRPALSPDHKTLCLSVLEQHLRHVLQGQDVPLRNNIPLDAVQQPTDDVRVLCLGWREHGRLARTTRQDEWFQARRRWFCLRCLGFGSDYYCGQPPSEKGETPPLGLGRICGSWRWT